MNIAQARTQLKTIPQVLRAYNLYQIDLKTKQTLIAEIKAKGKRISERMMGV